MSEDLERLSSVSLLQRLPADERERVLSTAVFFWYRRDDMVVREGDVGDAFFVVLQGEAEIFLAADGAWLGRVREGEWFGERAMLAGIGGRRTASVRACTVLRCAVIPRSSFESLYAPNREAFDDAAAEHMRQRLVQSVAALRGIHLDGPLEGAVSRVSLSAGQQLFRAGDAADAVYFVLEGILLVLRDDGERLASIGQGQSVGERGVLRGRPRRASVVCATDAELLRVEAAAFSEWHKTSPQLQDFLGSLEAVYRRTDGRELSVFRGRLEQWETIGTVCGDVMSARVVGQDLLMVWRGGPTPARTERFGQSREIHLSEEMEIVGVVARGIGPDVGELVRFVMDRERASTAALARFRKSGYLGGGVGRQSPTSLCGCMRIGRGDLLRVAEELRADDQDATLQAVCAASGAGAVCGACLPEVRLVLAGQGTSFRKPLEEQTAGSASDAPTARPRWGMPLPRVTVPQFSFDVEKLMAMRGVPEFHLMAVASIFAATGERLMLRTIGPLVPSMRDATLAAHMEAFLAQESNHVAAHAPLNELLMARIFPDSRALRRIGVAEFPWMEKLPTRLSLAACAAFECIADASFSTFFERYYGRGARRYHPDPRVHALAIESGIADLFHWHGCEELGHRHVAFAVMQSVKTPYLVRALGFLLLAAIGVFGLLPAIWSLRPYANRPIASAPPWTSALIALRSLKFLLPWFRPQDVQYRFMPQLRQDCEKYPAAE